MRSQVTPLKCRHPESVGTTQKVSVPPKSVRYHLESVAHQKGHNIIIAKFYKSIIISGWYYTHTSFDHFSFSCKILKLNGSDYREVFLAYYIQHNFTSLFPSSIF